MKMRINKAIACAVSFLASSACLAAAQPKTSTPTGSTGNLNKAKVVYRSTDLVQLDMRIVRGGKKTAKSCVITTQFGHESLYKDVREYRYGAERNACNTREVGVCVMVTPELGDDGMIGLDMIVQGVDEPTGKATTGQLSFQPYSMNRQLRLSPGKPMTVREGDLRVTVTPKIISFNRDSSAVKVSCNSNDIAQIDMQIARDGKKAAKPCVITTQFGHKGVYKDAKEYKYGAERNAFNMREVGVIVAVTPNLGDDGMIELDMSVQGVDAPQGKPRAGQPSFRVYSMNQQLRLPPGKPMTVLDGDFRVTVMPKIISSNGGAPAR